MLPITVVTRISAVPNKRRILGAGKLISAAALIRVNTVLSGITMV